jgi:hypothetical protein
MGKSKKPCFFWRVNTKGVAWWNRLFDSFLLGCEFQDTINYRWTHIGCFRLLLSSQRCKAQKNTCSFLIINLGTLW